MMLFYNVLLLVLLLPALLFFALRHRKHLGRDFLFGLKERCGIWRVTGETERPLLWVHGASLGEVRAVESMLALFPEYRILVTTLTSAGREYARKNAVGDDVRFLPADFGFCVGRTVGRLRPAALVVVETELWPGLFRAAERNGVPVVIVNARLSGRSYPWYRATRYFWRRILAPVERLAARSPEDAGRFAGLGFPGEKITVTGNIKYDRPLGVAGFARAEVGLDDRDFVMVAGSTRNGEEALLLDAWANLTSSIPRFRLVVAPRHLHRVAEVAEELRKRNIPFSLRSKGTRGPFECLLVDTFGELQRWYALGDVSFVGGSLVPRGGQNPVEPAAQSKPVLFGPSMDNFLSEMHILQSFGGGLMVRDAGELSARLRELHADAGLRRTMGERARSAVESQRGAAERAAQLIRAVIAGRTA